MPSGGPTVIGARAARTRPLSRAIRPASTAGGGWPALASSTSPVSGSTTPKSMVTNSSPPNAIPGLARWLPSGMAMGHSASRSSTTRSRAAITVEPSALLRAAPRAAARTCPMTVAAMTPRPTTSPMRKAIRPSVRKNES